MQEILKYLDIIIIFILVIFLLLTLRRLLGKKVGYIRTKPIGSLSDNTDIIKNDESKLNSKEKSENIENINYPEGSLSYKIELLKQKDGFDPKQFIESAKKAFTMIVNAFVKGDIATLKPFLTDDIYNNFVKSVENKEINQNIHVEIKEFMIVDIYDLEIDSQDNAKIVVKFFTKQIRKAYDDIVEINNLSRADIKEYSESWIFVKNLKDNTSIWKLSNTKM